MALDKDKMQREYRKEILEAREKMAPAILRNNAWYKSQGERCPFADVFDCHHYFQSRRVMEEFFYSISSAHRNKETEEMERYWKTKGRWNTHYHKQPNQYMGQVENFCPEAMHEHPDPFLSGIYAIKIVEYDESPEIYVDDKTGAVTEFPPSIIEAHQKLKESNASQDDWRWYFEELVEQHFTKCIYYLRRPDKPAISLESVDTEKTSKSKESVSLVQRVFEHTEDCRHIVFHGKEFDLTENQAAVIKVLNDNMKSCRESPRGLGQREVLERIKVIDGKFSQTFRVRNKVLLETDKQDEKNTPLVIQIKPHVYSLNIPPEEVY